MIILYIIKSSFCLLLILLFYKCVLENEKAHRFKRFFLLGGLFLSVAIPLLSFSFAIDPLADVTVLQLHEEGRQDFLQRGTGGFSPESSPSVIFPFLVYLAGVLIFSLRFINSLKNVIYQIIRGKKIRKKDHILVLTQDNLMHHTFLNFIFLNREKYEKNMIPIEIIEHELVHVRQRHSLDLLLVEILQVLLWFNPIVIFYRFLVKRNHEFLADEGVLGQHSNAGQYAELLLNQTSGFSNNPILSYFKDDFVKNRILMMTKSASLERLLIKLTALLPLLVISFLLFSNSSVAENTHAGSRAIQETDPAVQGGQEIKNIKYIDVIIKRDRTIIVQNVPLEIKNLNPTIHKILSSSNKDNQKTIVRIYAHGSLPTGFITDVENEIFRASPNIRSRKRFIMEDYDTHLNGGIDWFKKNSGTKFLDKVDVLF